MKQIRSLFIIICITVLWLWSPAHAEPAWAVSNSVMGGNPCGTLNQNTPTTFPAVDLSNCPPDPAPAPPHKAWQPLKADPGPACVDWMLYSTNQSGNWNIYRFGQLADKPKADPNISKGKGPGVVDMSPSRSPDNQWAAFSSNRSGNWEIYIGSVDGATQQRVTYSATAANITPIWSPDGTQIAFVSTRSGSKNIYTFDVTSGTETALTKDASNNVNPFWSSDSSKLLYQSDKSGKWQIEELTLATQTSKTLSDGSANDMNPQYSPDGKLIAFRSYRGGTGNNGVIMLMNSDGSNVTPISDPKGDALNQVWSFDGKLIAYQSSISGNGDIYAYQLSSGKSRRVTDNNVPDYAPTWRCNAAFIVFTSEIGGNPQLYQTSAMPMNNPGVKPEDVNQLSFDNSVDLFPEIAPPVEESSLRWMMGKPSK